MIWNLKCLLYMWNMGKNGQVSFAGHCRAVRYDVIYRMDEIKSILFHIMFYRLFCGVANYIVYGNTFSSFGWLRSLHATTGREGETEAGGERPQNEELVPKRGTTSVAWSRVFKDCSFKTTDFKPLKLKQQTYMFVPSLSVWEECTFNFLLILNNYINTRICVRIPVFASILINTAI